MCYKGNVPGEVEWKHLHIPHTYHNTLSLPPSVINQTESNQHKMYYSSIHHFTFIEKIKISP
jgi:hypothetical protein